MQREGDGEEPSSGATGAKHLFALPPGHHLGHRFVDGEQRVVKLQGVFGGLQGCNAALKKEQSVVTNN